VITNAEPLLLQGDLAWDLAERAMTLGEVAWDIETTGLDWRSDVIRTVQVAVGSDIAVVQLRQWETPKVLACLLEEGSIKKTFHHAAFDLRFMAYHWQLEPANIRCTKVAAKIAEPGLGHGSYSLRPLLRRHLSVDLDKSEQTSDWSVDDLSPAQLAYAGNDVRYLSALHAHLVGLVEARGALDLLSASYGYLPARVRLDLDGAGDVFAY